MVGKQNWTLEPSDQLGHLGQTFKITGQSESHIAMSLRLYCSTIKWQFIDIHKLTLGHSF